MLAEIRISRFRNLHAAHLELRPGPALFWGKNGQGKTNLLEAVYYLSALRSFRQATSPQLIEQGEHSFELRARLGEEPCDELSVAYGPDKKRVLCVNGNRVARSTDMAGRLNCVVLHPADLRLARGRHSERLRWIDYSICQIEPGYLRILARFQRTLELRNAALRQGASKSEFDALDEHFAAAAQAVAERRRQSWPALLRKVTEAYGQIARAGEIFGLSFESDVDGRFAQRLAGLRQRERESGVSLAGPHRDRVAVTINGLEAGHASSEGQARSAALAFKIAQARFIRDELGRTPVLLIDDVWGELDEARREGLQSLMLESPQILLTATDVSRAGLPGIASGAQAWKVSAGRLSASD